MVVAGQVAENAGSPATSAVGDGAVRTPRTNMFIGATLEWNGESVAATVRNLSPTGALVEAAWLPPAGTIVRLLRGPLVASGTIAWSGGRQCGVRIDGPIAVAQWMGKPGAAARPSVRRDDPARPGGRSDDRGSEHARDLEIILAAVQATLAANPAVVADHAAELAKLDLIARGLAQLANRGA